MSTDLIKYDTAEKNAGFFQRDFWKARSYEPASLPGGHAGAYPGTAYKGVGSEAGRDQARLLRDMIGRHRLDQDGWQRCMSATVAWLNGAQTMLGRAEELLAAQAARISALEDLATSDELTGLKNRRGFFDAFAQELDRCERGISKGGLLALIDLDNFKIINDTYGHMAGDACLRLVAKTLAQEIRVMDSAARLGGDEFVLLLSNTTKGEAAARAQKLAWQLNHLSLAWYGEEIPVRASLGLKSYKKGDSAKKIFSAADIALYADKREKGDKSRH